MLISGIVLVVAALAVLLAAPLMTERLRRRAVIDTPNDRSSHSVPTPRGAGILIAVSAGAALVVVFLLNMSDPRITLVLVGLAAVTFVSCVDDRRGMGPGPRLAAHLAAVVLGLAGLPTGEEVLGLGVPIWIDRLLVGIGWIWFVNLFNFMDGIDGLASVEAATIGIGAIIAAAMLSPSPGWLAAILLPAAAVAGGSLGFLKVNWHPASVFLGDAGSIPIGYTLGYVLVVLAAAGALEAALILPLMFVTDATWTLIRRLARGAKPWQAHREHAYQRAVAAGQPHDRVVLRVLALNLVLVALAMASFLAPPGVSLAAALAITIVVLNRLDRGIGTSAARQ